MADVTIAVKLFAAYQETIGREALHLTVPAGTRAIDICDRLIAEHPALAEWRSQTRFGINLEFVPPETELQSNDELVLIPPVSGG